MPGRRMDDSRVLPFSQRVGNGGEPPANDELVEPGNAFAVVRGTRAPPALRFFLASGKSFAMPYHTPPIVWGESPALVLLEYPGFFTVILAGHNLGLLEARLCEQRVSWIRQCPPGQVAGDTVMVTRIERMNRYPSREHDGTKKTAG